MANHLFRNAAIYSPQDRGKPASGHAQGDLLHIPQGALLVTDGKIAAIEDEASLLAKIAAADIASETDCRGQCLIPGFVDPHTHICFARRRESEFALRIRGTPYLEILKQGGGILSSVKAVAQTDESQLFEVTRRTALSAMAMGTTTMEVKSGYGLDTENELKMLRVIEQIGQQTPLDVVATFMGAHAVPTDFKDDPDAFVRLVIEEMIPAVEAQGIARFCDVFCEQGVFTLDQSRRILESARDAGLGMKIHADEVHDLGGGGLAAELGAASADHLLSVSDENISRLADSSVVAVLLPATAYSLRKPYARARDMISAGLPVALATDCNPGSSYTESMPFVFGLSVMMMEMSPTEALTGVTLNAAYAIGMARQVGSLDVGKQADFLLLDGETPAMLAYRAGVSPVTAVYKRGKKVASNSRVSEYPALHHLDWNDDN
ncbi:MAG: imidazolonepropionase [Desulfosarcinaceae bacterium]|nr:imidazolonepropionase [Desulfosarcinaceae bacterium]